jgi:hypothetical protein
MFGTECPWDGKIRNALGDRRGRGEELSERDTGRGFGRGGTDKGEKRGYEEDDCPSDGGSVIKFHAVRFGEMSLVGQRFLSLFSMFPIPWV